MPIMYSSNVLYFMLSNSKDWFIIFDQDLIKLQNLCLLP